MTILYGEDAKRFFEETLNQPDLGKEKRRKAAESLKQIWHNTDIYLFKGKPLPCPFCGKQPNLIHCEEECCGALPRWFECECGLTFDVTGVQTDEEAIKKWNMRYV